MVFLIMCVVLTTHIGAALDVPSINGEIAMTARWIWLVYVVCFAVVLAVADMNLDKALGIS